MSQLRARSAGGRSVGKSRANVNRRRHPHRLPWVFRPPVRLPSLFPPPPQVDPPEPDPAPEPAAADDAAVAPDAAPPPDPDPAAPGESEEYGRRQPPKRPPPPRAVPGVTATISWTKKDVVAFPFTDAPAGGGVYIVLGGTRPIYVGEAQNFGARWNKRLLEAYEVGLIGSTFAASGVTVWFGAIDPVPPQNDRQALESALIRVLINGGLGGPLRNGTQFNPIKPTKAIKVLTALPDNLHTRLSPQLRLEPPARAAVVKAHAENTLLVAPDTVFELG